MKNSACFFRNSDCEIFPCHKIHDMENFNCLFCYCPLYHFADCGGNHETLPNGIKDCSNCTLPHRDYDTIIEKLKKRVSIRNGGNMKLLQNIVQRNIVQCNICGDIIESTHRHDFKRCKCGRIAVDGGHDYVRVLFKKEGDYTDLSIYEGDDND